MKHAARNSVGNPERYHWLLFLYSELASVRHRPRSISVSQHASTHATREYETSSVETLSCSFFEIHSHTSSISVPSTRTNPHEYDTPYPSNTSHIVTGALEHINKPRLRISLRLSYLSIRHETIPRLPKTSNAPKKPRACYANKGM